MRDQFLMVNDNKVAWTGEDHTGSQRIAMRTGSETYLLFGDHLASSILLVRGEGTVAEKAYYLPWGGTRGGETISSSAYAYTGQMREGDIYYYGARWYDPSIGRFMQADTIVPLQVQGTQAFDRYAYVNNNPLRFTDPSGNRVCDDYYGSGCNVISPLPINYQDLISRVYGVNLDSKTSFSNEQQKVIHDALSLISYGAQEHYDLPGSRWVIATFGGTLISHGGWAADLLNCSVTLPNTIQLQDGFDSTFIYVIVHEFGHILDNRKSLHGFGTYIGLGPSDLLAVKAGVFQWMPTRFLHFFPEMNGAVIVPNNRFDVANRYGNASSADYFAEGFMLMITNPDLQNIPPPVRDFFSRFLRRR